MAQTVRRCFLDLILEWLMWDASQICPWFPVCLCLEVGKVHVHRQSAEKLRVWWRIWCQLASLLVWIHLTLTVALLNTAPILVLLILQLTDPMRIAV